MPRLTVLEPVKLGISFAQLRKTLPALIKALFKINCLFIVFRNLNAVHAECLGSIHIVVICLNIFVEIFLLKRCEFL